MKLDLRFTNRPLDEIYCQGVAALIFSDSDDFSLSVTRLNEKLAGLLKDLKEKGVWTGNKGEKFLVASQSSIRSDKILLYGLGNSREYADAHYPKDLNEVGVALDKIGIAEFGLSIPPTNSVEHEYGKVIESSICSLVDVFIHNHGDDHDFILKLIVSVENDLMESISSAETGLREYFTPVMEYSLITDNSYDIDLREDAA